MIHYQKRKNSELFESLENPTSLFLSKTQNYNPFYKTIFSLNTTNYNNINLNHVWYLSEIKNNIDDTKSLFTCDVTNTTTKKTKTVPVFFKYAPLLDPCKFLIGKYINDKNLLNLPQLENEDKINPKMLDVNNSAYIDSFFVYLTSKLLHEHRFIHGLDFYGSFLSIKNNYRMNIYDDLEYLSESDFFNKNKNVLFKVENYDYILNNTHKLKTIKIHSLVKSMDSVELFDNTQFEHIFNDSNDCDESEMIDMTDITEMPNMSNITLKSTSTCSSRSSHTISMNQNEKCECCDTYICSKNDSCQDCECDELDTGSNESDDSNDSNDSNKSIDDSQTSEESEEIFATIPEFPVQVICMEHCHDTLDNLIMENDLSNEEWYSAFMQIIMILITYQKVFALTHNDLHTNNVMYNVTNKKYIYYKYNSKYYKVPTFGRLYKIIDFGRAIYRCNKQAICSDSFKMGGDAAGQYNIEPYFNENKPRLEPNYSFDLSRLACSIFDYLIEDMTELNSVIKKNPIAKLICEWCTDDNNVNILYKNNGDERYPDFKLYKMIARFVHNHTPQVQLDRPEFKAFLYKKEDVKEIIDIDAIPSYI